MNAQEQGARQGREYVRSNRIEELTFEAYCQDGKSASAQSYQQEKAQSGFLYGWRQAGDQFRTLFKEDDHDIRGGEQRIRILHKHTEMAVKQLDVLCSWRKGDQELHDVLSHAREMLVQAQHALERALTVV